ncbi:MAG TPA: S8 family serine peptidase [Candidatus Limnocylindrales bacterium]
MQRQKAHSERYLVQPANPKIAEKVKQEKDIRVVREIVPAAGKSEPILVVEMEPTRAAQLAEAPELLVEADHPLGYGIATLPVLDPGVAPLAEGVPFTVQVEDAQGGTLDGAAVHVFGAHSIAQALTDKEGRATLTLSEQDIEGAAGVYVQPRGPFWSSWQSRPLLSTGEPHRIACAPVDPDTVEHWAQRAMGFDRLPPTFRGHGIKVAVIDSGADLGAVQLEENEPAGWDEWQGDTVGFGTVAIGLIARLAPEAHLHVAKVSPGGRFGDLVAAIDHCLAEQVDLIVLGPGSPYTSWLVARKLEEAAYAGIACIAAAGNSSGPVSFPASLPGVLAVGAIGKVGTFPPGSYHTTQLTGTPTQEGFFAARLSASGPELDLCAPGVGVSVNGGVLDGTQVAAAHVGALAVLVMAHHPEFRNGFRVRGSGRVQRLQHVLRTACRPLPTIDPARVGAGLPDAVAAVGLVPGIHGQQSRPAISPLSPFEGRTRDISVLRAAMVSAGLA